MEEQDYQTVAIVALTGRFPGADDVASFWQKIVNEEKGIQRLDANTLTQRGVPKALQNHADFVNVDTHLANLEAFDAAFFGINPREAKAMDPQHRMLLESTLNLLREAAISPHHFEGDIGLFAGVGFSQYLLHNIAKNPQEMDALGENYTIIGNHLSYACTRVAHFFNFKGPVVALDTACSSSLLSVHLACKSLLNYECDLALAGGVQLNMPQFSGYRYEEGGFRSPDGECRTFDNAANGTVFGSGIGLVALRRLDDALTDGDRIIALIRGSAINNDGSDKVGFTAPSVAGQRDVIEKALAFSGIDAASIGYVEAHGTGTPLGDPIELRALSEAYSHFTDAKQYCAIGSLKPAFSHMETASGVASLIKTALMLENNLLPATLNYQSPNQQIGFENTPFYVNTQTRPWPESDYPRRAAVSSFGIGGSNAHVILEAFDAALFADDDDVELMQHTAPQNQGDTAAPPQPFLLLLSAKSEAALLGVAASTARQIAGDCANRHTGQPSAYDGAHLASLAYHLKHSTPAYSHRVAIAGHTANALSEALSAANLAKKVRVLDETKSHQAVFMFPGQGAQYVDMGSDLYACEPVFKHWVDTCCTYLQGPLGEDLRETLFPQTDAKYKEANAKLSQTTFVQPALFVIEYALAQLWLSKGVQPVAFIGHSLGEYVAACLSGVFALQDVLSLICQRAQLMQSAQAGAMTAVACEQTQLQACISKANAAAQPNLGCEVSAHNAKNLFVVSGSEQSIHAFEAVLTAENLRFTRLNTSHAYHSSMMDAAASAFVDAVKKVPMHAPSTPFVSCVSGNWISAQEATSPQYWGKQIRASVNFAKGLDTLSELENPVLIEVGPGQHLTVLAKKHLATHAVISSLPNLNAKAGVTKKPFESGQESVDFTAALGQCWQWGLALDWDVIFGSQPRPRLPLPPYAFQRETFWVLPADAEVSKGLASLETPVHLEAPAATKPPEQDPLADWFQSLGWQSESMQQTLGSVSVMAQSNASSKTPWLAALDAPLFLVFDNGSACSREWIARLEQAVSGVKDHLVSPIVVTLGEQFVQHHAQHFEMKSGDVNHMQQLFTALTQQWQQAQKAQGLSGSGVKGRTLYIANFWTLNLNDTLALPTLNSEPDTATALACDIALNDFMHLVQRCAELPINRVRCCAITQNANAVLGTESVQAFASLVESACKVISHEFKDWRFVQVDTDAVSLSLVPKVIAAVFESDAILAHSVEPAVVLRQRKRWQKRYQKETLPPLVGNGEANPEQAVLKPQGTYLITGGLGGIGFALASHLASRYRAKLILLGRTALPDRSSWADVTANTNTPTDANTQAKAAAKVGELIAKVQTLEALGAEVIPVVADTANYDELANALDHLPQVTACNGIFHGAGVAWSASLLFSSKADVMRVMLGKVQGARNLQRYFQHAFTTQALRQPLDFTVYFSSIWSVLGGPGLLAYTGANRYLDALSACSQGADYCAHTLAINWSGWAQVGMAAELFSGQQANNQQDPENKPTGILPEQGIAALMRVLHQPRILQDALQLVIAPNAASALENRAPKAIQTNAQKAASAKATKGAEQANTQTTSKMSQPSGALLDNPTEAALAEIWQETLGITEVSAEDNFFDLGGTSLLLSEVLRKVKQRISDDVKIIDLFNYPTIRALSASLTAAEVKDDALDEIAQRANKRRSQAKKRAGRGSTNDSQV